RIGAAAKASPPFAPAFATTLVVLTTDAGVPYQVLDGMLSRAVARSFERVLVDQGPGMADTVVMLANGTAAAPTLEVGSEGGLALESALSQLCESLAEGLAMRVPWARKLVVVTVHGAARHADALGAARAGAGSVAVRAGLAAGLPVWPAVLDALGAAPVELDPNQAGGRFGPVTGLSGGRAAPPPAGPPPRGVAAKAQVDPAVALGVGSAAATVTTTDLPPEALTAFHR